jgi:DNA-binding transcriptional LysR family regulator
MPIFTTAARCLIEVIEAGSIRRAAEVLNIAPSAVNRHILNLESEYRTQLLERLPRGVRPTEAGTLFAERIRKWQAELEVTTAELAVLKGEDSSAIVIGLVECFSGRLFANVLAAARAVNPSVSLVARIGGTRELVELLDGGEVDLVVAFNLPRSSDFWVLDTTSVPMGVVVHPNHAFASLSSVTLRQCAGEPMLLADDSLTLRPLIDAILPLEHVKVPPLTSNSIGLIKSAIAVGTGISILTIFDVRDEVNAGTLVFVPLADPEMNQELSVCARDEAVAMTASATFASELMKEVRRVTAE